jgi:phosphoglycerol transferase MdoB-like AlkP superfamily enzyme
MAKKVKKVIKRKPVKKSERISSKFQKVTYYKKKFNLVLKKLLLFVILFVLSLVLYSVSGKEIYENLFLLLAIVFGFVSIAFLIILLIFLFLKGTKK